ncbi:zeta toxin family protein [Pantoea sp.]|uniref:zeta toxin family protein n=1 Tax=Pantoea sp. TaxID=69393 RepID=UPI0031E1D960
MNTKPEDFTGKQLELATKKLWKKLVIREGLTPVETPQGYFIGGQPGAGKSSSIDRIRNDHGKNFLEVNVDDYRQHHPNFAKIQEKYGDNSPAYTNAFADAVRDNLVKKALEERINVSVEGTMKTLESTQKRLDEFKNSGYGVNVIVQTCNPALSRYGIQKRYDDAVKLGQTPRDVPIEFHDKCVYALKNNVDKIMQNNPEAKFEMWERTVQGDNKQVFPPQNKQDIKPSEVLKDIFNPTKQYAVKRELEKSAENTQGVKKSKGYSR